MRSVIDTRENMKDGYFKLDYKEDGVYITVYPAIADGKKVTIPDVTNRLAKKRVKNYIKVVVDEEVRRPTKKPLKIAEKQEEIMLDGTVDVIVSEDKMKAYVVFIPPDGGNPITKEAVLEALRNNGVVFGINEELLDSMVKYPSYHEKIQIAEGKRSVSGQNGQIEFLFNIKKESKPTILEDGRVDYRDLNIIKNVQVGQKLCVIVPPLMGVPGKNVVGTEIKALDGKSIRLPRGRNVEVNEDETELISAIDGEVEFIEGKVSVNPSYDVPADVGASTGNIKFVGNVTVRGNVLSGYEIDAGGNVEVFGVVEAATIKAKGDIIIRRGMQGNDKGMLISGRDIISKYIEHSIVKAENIIKAESIMHSDLSCKNYIELSGKKGLLVGGKCKVGKEIFAKVIGSHMATMTDIEVGSDPGLKEKYLQLKDELNSLTNDQTKTEQVIVLLQRMEKSGSIDEKKKELLARCLRTIVHIKERIEELKKEIEVINEKLNEDTKGTIHVSETINQGCKITIGTSTLFIKDTTHRCSIYRDGDIRIGQFKK